MNAGELNNVSQLTLLVAIDGTVIGPVLTLREPLIKLFRLEYCPYRYEGGELVYIDIVTGFTLVKDL